MCAQRQALILSKRPLGSASKDAPGALAIVFQRGMVLRDQGIIPHSNILLTTGAETRWKNSARA